MQRPAKTGFRYLESFENLLENIGYTKSENSRGIADFEHKEKGIRIHALRFLSEQPRQWYGILEFDKTRDGKRYTACVFLEENNVGVVKTYSGIKEKLDFPDNINTLRE